MNRRMVAAACACGLLITESAAAQGKGGGGSPTMQPVALTALSTLPVKEITVFKDGHAFLSHAGTLALREDGHAYIDRLPTPVIGTFWAGSTDPDVPLMAAMASRRRVMVERTSLNLPDVIRANVGASAFVKEGEVTYHAQILEIPTRSAEEFARTSPADAEQRLALPGEIVLLKTELGIKPVPISKIHDITFTSPPKTSFSSEEFRNLLTLTFDPKDTAQREAHVAVTYLQKGVRWIPGYRVSLGDDGHATVELQATLINELTDLDGVTMHLVIGVPTFALRDTIDPIALQQTARQLSEYFTQDAGAFANTLMSQSAQVAAGSQQFRRSQVERSAPAADLGPDIAGVGEAEDLFIFTIPDVTLAKGDRMVLPVASCTLPYRDVFTLDLPFTPPATIRPQHGFSPGNEAPQQLASPKVIHNVRVTNRSEYPLTTAPAVVFRDGQLVAQGLVTYTAIGATSDLEITPAVDVQVQKQDIETQRTPDAETWQKQRFAKIDLAGAVTLTSYRDQAIDVEVTRHIAGHLESATHGGAIAMINALEYDPGKWGRGVRSLLGWYDWPNWWLHFNGFGNVKWTVSLEPGKPLTLEYAWYYYWGT